MKLRATSRHKDVIQLQMTPMIDIVFLLLIFFVMTFKIIAPEGDFNIKMPLADPSQGMPDPDQLPPIKVRLKANSAGELSAIGYGDRSLGRDFDKLHALIRSRMGDDPTPAERESTEVEFDCDYNLKYEYVLAAITAVSGYVKDGEPVQIVGKVKFSPPRGP
jgi:biopolymer transport protein ExbD